MRGFDPNQIYNTDQSGFNLELLSGRTLENKGTQKVHSSIRSKHSSTHSYTAQFLITADGELKAPLVLILQEKNGVFGENVKKTMFKSKELRLFASSSGKTTKDLVYEWFQDPYFKVAGNESYLTTYKDRTRIDEDKPPNKDYNIITVPPGLTGILQPLDVLFNRSYKAFVRRISDYINFHHVNTIKLHTRDTFLKIRTIVHNQFRSPLFKSFIRHAWVKSGLVDKPDTSNDDEDIASWFDDPIGYCFDAHSTLNNGCSLCEPTNLNPSFIRCAWCKFHFCFHHPFLAGEDGFHYCEVIPPTENEAEAEAQE